MASDTGRRGVLAAIAGAPLATLPLAAATAASSDADPVPALFTRREMLMREMDAANARFDRLRADLVGRWGDLPPYVSAEARWGHDPACVEFDRLWSEGTRLSDEFTRLIDEILAAPACSLRGTLMKLRVAIDEFPPSLRRDPFNPRNGQRHERAALQVLLDAERVLGRLA